jgi:hypothetical protein
MKSASLAAKTAAEMPHDRQNSRASAPFAGQLSSCRRFEERRTLAVARERIEARNWRKGARGANGSTAGSIFMAPLPIYRSMNRRRGVNRPVRRGSRPRDSEGAAVRRFTGLMVLAVAWCAIIAATPHPKSPKVKHLKAVFIGFSAVDYVNAVFCVGDSVEFLGVTDAVAAFFVAAHPGVPLDVEAAPVDEQRPGEGYGLEAASLAGYRSDEWWSDVTRVYGHERAWLLFNALEESLTTYPDDPRPVIGCSELARPRRERR